MSAHFSPPNSFKLLRRFRLVNFLFHQEPTLRYLTLLGASLILSVVSFYTTLRGFEALTHSIESAVALSLAVQVTLFWTARELGNKGASWKEASIFSISALLSVAFSFGYISDKIDAQGSAAIKLANQIQRALGDIDIARLRVERTAQKCESSAERWKTLQTNEDKLGNSTPVFRGVGEGGLTRTYQSYRQENLRDAHEVRAMLPKLIGVEASIKKLREIFELTGVYSEEIMKGLREEVNKARIVYKPDRLEGALGTIQQQEQVIYDGFFKPYEGTIKAKAFSRLVEYKPDVDEDLFSAEKLSIMKSEYNQFIEKLKSLFFERSPESVLAFLLAVGLDFMILLCSFATNHGIPLRVMPNQEMAVDALMRAESLKDRYPTFMHGLHRKGRRIMASLSFKDLKAGESVPAQSLTEKNKLAPSVYGVGVAPDLLDFVLRAAYIDAVTSEVASSMENDPRIERLIEKAVVRGGKLRVPVASLETGGWDGLILMDLLERGLLDRKFTWRGKVEYVFTDEMVKCCELLRKSQPEAPKSMRIA